MHLESDTRTRIVQAAAEIMQQSGTARATTREIARLAGCSEGNIYNHFGSKEVVFLFVLREQFPPFMPMILALPERIGNGTVQGNLEELALTALAFYDQSIPIGASFFSEQRLLARHREMLKQRGAGPHKANEAVAAYLEAERKLGRVHPEANPAAMADMLLGACLIRAYWRQFLGKEPFSDTDEQFVEGLLQTLMPHLSPAPNPSH